MPFSKLNQNRLVQIRSRLARVGQLLLLSVVIFVFTLAWTFHFQEAVKYRGFSKHCVVET